MLVAGVDSSTQSTKVLLCRAEDGAVVGQAAAPHPDGTECDPERRWRALASAGHGLLDRAEATGIAAQPAAWSCWTPAARSSGPRCCVERPAVRAAGDGAHRRARRPAQWARRTGSVPSASFTVTKLRWLAEHEPAAAERTAHVLLPHDWLTAGWPGVADLPGEQAGA